MHKTYGTPLCPTCHKPMQHWQYGSSIWICSVDPGHHREFNVNRIRHVWEIVFQICAYTALSGYEKLEARIQSALDVYPHTAPEYVPPAPASDDLDWKPIPPQSFVDDLSWMSITAESSKPSPVYNPELVPPVKLLTDVQARIMNMIKSLKGEQTLSHWLLSSAEGRVASRLQSKKLIKTGTINNHVGYLLTEDGERALIAYNAKH